MTSQRFLLLAELDHLRHEVPRVHDPEGLFGLLRMTAFVYEPTLSAMSGTVGTKLPSSGVDRDGTPPASLTISG
jgi:hypothetical protein